MKMSSRKDLKPMMRGRKKDDVKATKKELPLANKKDISTKRGHGTGRKG